jgi:hypothetical protein
VRFRTTIEQAGKTATGIQVPEEVVQALGSGRRPAVTVTINGYSYRSTVAVLGGRYMVGSAPSTAPAPVSQGVTRSTSTSTSTPPRGR